MGFWVLTAAVGFPYEFFIVKWNWNGTVCIAEGDSYHWDQVIAIMVSGCLCLCCYAVITARSCCISATMPDVVLRRCYWRAGFYPLNFLVSYGFILVCYTFGVSIDKRNAVFFVAMFTESLSGSLNALTYAVQSRY